MAASPVPSRSGQGSRCRGDEGSVVATAPLLGLTFVMFLLVVQISLWFYGRMAITAAAQHGLDAARISHDDANGNPDLIAQAAGEQVVDEFMSQIGGVDGYTPTVDVEPDEVTVTVSADAFELLVGLPLPSMTVELTASREQVVG